MALIEPCIKEVLRASNLEQEKELSEAVWSRSLPGFIPVPDISVHPYDDNKQIAERVAGYMGKFTTRNIRMQCLGIQYGGTLDMHVDGAFIHSAHQYRQHWRVHTDSRGEYSLLMGTIKPSVIENILAEYQDWEQRRLRVREQVQIVEKLFAQTGLIDDTICRPDLYATTMAVGGTVVFRSIDAEGHEPAMHDFVTIGEENSRDYYEANVEDSRW